MSKCKHIYEDVYEEVGGGGLDAGTPVEYRKCILCGKTAMHTADRVVIAVLVSILSFLLGLVFR